MSNFNEILIANNLGNMVSPDNIQDLGISEVRFCSCGVKLSRYNENDCCHSCKERANKISYLRTLNQRSLDAIF